MSTFRLQKVANLDRPPKTLTLYEEDGIRMRRHSYVNPVRCIDCKSHERGTCHRFGGVPVKASDYCSRGVRRG